ncbi:MAG: trehalose-phosphatase [Hyphomicrobiaceae bacterium]|jgi:trehalose 6-phosphate phosphatase
MSFPEINPETDALFLDLDGTMIDIAPHPDDVVAPRQLICSLARLSDEFSGAIAIISGRPIAALDALLEPLLLPAAGVHGAEIRFEQGQRAVERAAPSIPNGVRWLLAPLSEIPGVVIEDKTTAIAVHFRQAPEAEERVREVVEKAVKAHEADELAIVPGKYVYEIKHARFSKGTAVAEFMSRPPWAGRRPVFIGDDVTDEAAFAVLPRWNGEGLAVGQDRPGARARFANAAEVRQWLASLVGQECTS